MQKFHVVTNDAKDKELAVTKMLEQYFISHGRKCTRNISCMDKEDVPEDTDCVIVIGGDGTFLHKPTTTSGDVHYFIQHEVNMINKLNAQVF